MVISTRDFSHLVSIPTAEEVACIAPVLNQKEKNKLREKAKQLLAEKNAVLVAHYYTDPDLQVLADETGGHVADSLDMARFGYEHSAQTVVVAGVRFMGETAKILNPEKRILVPEMEANCSLDLGCPADKFEQFRAQYPDHVVVVYANTSAAVKAQADWMVTSSIGLDIATHLHQQGKKILWAPDKHLGNYIQQKTGADMIMWNGSCIVHHEFKARELYLLKAKHPEATILAHPESPSGVLELADIVGSTSALINAVKTMNAETFIIATDKGIFHKMRQVARGKNLIEAPTAGEGATCQSCAHCPWMAMNGLKNLVHVLEHGSNEIIIPQDIIERAVIPVKRMLDFAANQNKTIVGDA